MGLVLHVIRRPLFGIAKHGMCIDHKVKESAVAGLLVIGMVAARYMPKHPLDCAGVGVGAEFQRVVKVTKLEFSIICLFEHPGPLDSSSCGRPWTGPLAPLAALARSLAFCKP